MTYQLCPKCGDDYPGDKPGLCPQCKHEQWSLSTVDPDEMPGEDTE